MINWHASTCRHPDVLFLDHLEVPSCLNCGEIGTVEKDTELTNAADDLPEQPSLVEFNLRWPSSLTFVDDTSTAYSLTDTISMLNVNAENIDGEQGTSGNPPESPATSLYEPLFARKIRLLRLLPGSRHEPLRCDLQTADLALKPDYEALSYTWADLKNDTSLTQRIYVGERHDVLFVTTNCANALRRLRSPRRKRTLWVDSICINQENIDERSHQVGIMQYIYASALRVLIYLGEDPKDPNPQTSTPWMFENHGNTLDLRVDLSNQLYFTRTWIIQEIASAKSAWVMYGSRGMRWQDFLGTSDSRSHNSSRTITKNRKRLRLSHPWIKMFPKPEHRQINKLYKVILATTRCRASDPRDKVFALLGLFNDATQAGLVADYSLSTAQVFSGTTAYILQENPKAWCSVFAMANSTVSQNMPFWTVNWAVPNQLPKPKEPSTQVYLEPTDSGPTLYFAQQPFYGTNGPYNPGPGSSIQLLPGMKYLRFLQIGCLVMTGFSPFSLGDCLLNDNALKGPPGIITGIDYEPYVLEDKREAQLAAAPWAKKTDKLFVVAGLPNHLLILRPMPIPMEYSYVAICDPPRVDYGGHLANCLGKEACLLISAWNTILKNNDSLNWLRPSIWAAIRGVSDNIRSWRTEILSFNPTSLLQHDDFLLSSRYMLSKFKHIERRYDFHYSDAGSRPSGLFDDVLSLQACWTFGEGPKMSSEDSPLESKTRRTIPWKPDYFLDGSVSDFQSRLQHAFYREPFTERVSSEDFLNTLLGANLSTLTGQYEEIMWRHDLKIQQGFTALAWNPFLGPDSPTLRLLREQLQLHSSSTSGTSSSDRSSTWASDFVAMWSLLVNEQLWRPQSLHNTWAQMRRELASPHMSSEKWQQLWGMVWPRLLDFVETTEEYLLPLERTLRAGPEHGGMPKHFWKFPPFVAEAIWEDIHIG